MTVTVPTTLMRRGYVDVDRGQLHYRSAGDGPTTVVLLHQTAASGAMYEAFVTTALAAEDGSAFRFIALDSPGFGNSFTSPTPFSINDVSKDFLQALDALGVGSFHVLGHHTGVAMAVHLGVIAPERVLSVTMFGPLAITAEQNADHFAKIHPIVYEETGHYMLDVWEYASGAPVGSPLRPDLALHHREVVDKLKAGDRFHEAYQAVFTADIGAELALVTAPILLLVSAADSLNKYLDQTLAANPAMLHRELDAGVYVFDQDPALVARTIRETGIWSA